MDNSQINKATTIGKFLRAKKHVTADDFNFVGEDMPPSRKRYLDSLIPKGLKMNKLSVGKFKGKNGSQYCGIYATEEIYKGETVMEIPHNLLITARDAWESPLKFIFQENPDYFNPTTPNKLMDSLQFILEQKTDYYFPFRYNLWEFRMNLVYFVYELSRGEESPLYDIFENIPKVIDTAAFWEEDELQLLEDKSLVRFAKLARETFEDEAKSVMELASRYPTILKKEYFTYENIKWMYLALYTRQYEAPLKYQGYAPIGEYLNHETIGVVEYMPKTDGVTADKSKYVETKTEEDDGNTSDDTIKSVEQDYDSDFEYDKEEVPVKETVIFEEKKEQEEPEETNLFAAEEALRTRATQIRNIIVNELNWGDHITVFFANQVLTHLRVIDNDLQNGKISLEEADKQVTEAESQLAAFSKEITKYHEEALLWPKELSARLEQFRTIDRRLRKPIIPLEKRRSEDENWEENAKRSLGLKAICNYKKNAQIHLFYGRNSNRFMLVHYGAAVEYNKYENVHFKFPYFKSLTDKWLLEKVKYFKMSKVKKLKVRRRKFALELATYYKALNWKAGVHTVDDLFYVKDLGLELKALGMMKDLFEEFLENCKNTEEELEAILKDPKTHYRVYFATITNLERQRCIRFHLKALLVLIEILNRLMNGEKIEQAMVRVPELETVEEHGRNRNFFLNYMNRFAFKKP